MPILTNTIKSGLMRLGQEYSEYGLVGENLTIDDFDEKSVKIGDEFEVGSCILQVSQPRIPCFK